MSSTKLIVALLLSLLLAGPALSDYPAMSWDIENAQGANDYFFNFFTDQVNGLVFSVGGTSLLHITQLGVFDMNPDNEPYWDEEHPTLAEHGLQHDHGVAIFSYPDMVKLGEVIVPAGTEAPIRNEGYRYMPLPDPVILEPGSRFVLASWWASFSIADGGADTHYLISDTPGVIPSEFNLYDTLTLLDGCFNPAPVSGPAVDAPFVFNMYWGLYAGGANFLIEVPIATESETWDAVKSLYR
jgi:hypothetical protein